MLRRIMPFIRDLEDWLIDSIKDAIILVDKDTKILYVNSQWEKIIGISANQAIGKKLEDIEPDALLNIVVKTGKPEIGKRVIHRKTGFEVISNSIPIFDKTNIVGGIGIFKEVSQFNMIINKMQRAKKIMEYHKEQLKLRSSLPDSFASLIGENKEFLNALFKAYRASQSSANVLILGESGVGKNLLAKAIHMSGSRKDKPFVDINCAAIPETLLESELFGYVRGSFTGANREGKLGKVEIANGGTLFLDEIADMSINMQSKLLKLIQERTIERIGDNKQIQVDIRIIAATNRDLMSMVNNGTFREDLYYRLSVIPIYLPPLRERKEDIPLLIDYFIKKYNSIYNKSVYLSKDVYNLLKMYNWPGNIRELSNVIEYAVLMCPSGPIKTEHLPEISNLRVNKFLGSWEIIKIDHNFPKLKYLLEEIEKKAILSALKMSNNNKTKAMEALGLNRRTFYMKLKKYNLNGKVIRNTK
ncbi:sigma 54-interacting transcriptional regulator [Desulfofundulus sp. TPOSR]|uniref:sigma-54 interaction domain-containing protein n=1 Tax=Desulfofundulus sp. TPOSR TaxID=2714340 RepID=UPI00140AC3A5|nr:sigma 54-interacting transcriptional regulator [Desulfofundulus sp. TPOSR]NHM26558.1 sigma 54-interacting transcriptional regulator [Desulfofundulus sp. TPOSR]